MPQDRALETHRKLVDTATRLFQLNGFSATSVDDICQASGVKKGAFFYQFASKEALAAKCLENWRDATAQMIDARIDRFANPIDQLKAAMDFFLVTLAKPEMIRSCLAGTTLQEVSESSEPLRKAANACLVSVATAFKTWIERAAESTGAKVDAAALGQLWIATLQGSLILYKGSRDPNVIVQSLSIVKDLILRSVTTKDPISALS